MPKKEEEKTTEDQILGKLENMESSFNAKLNNATIELVEKIEELEDEKVKPNTQVVHKHDIDIGRLYERTNSRNSAINRYAERPTDTPGLIPLEDFPPDIE